MLTKTQAETQNAVQTAIDETISKILADLPGHCCCWKSILSPIQVSRRTKAMFLWMVTSTRQKHSFETKHHPTRMSDLHPCDESWEQSMPAFLFPYKPAGALIATLLIRAGVERNPGPETCSICNKRFWQSYSVWCHLGGYVHLKCSSLKRDTNGMRILSATNEHGAKRRSPKF